MRLPNQPLISVLMPVYNGESFVALAIESILNQSYRDFEFIIIDDGSTDNTSQIVRHYKNVDDRIILISRENRGLTSSLNEGIEIASGKWIARMDADDISFPDRFERQLSWLDKTGADICGSWIQYFGVGPSYLHSNPESDLAIKVGLLFGCMLAHPTIIVRASLLKSLKYDADWDRAEDYELWTRMALANAKMSNAPVVLLKYRVHAKQISAASAYHQRELTQNIRRKYWKYSSLVRDINPELIDEFLKLYDPLILRPDMAMVDECINQLLTMYQGESRDIILKFGQIAYLKACQFDNTAWKRWRDICRRIDHHLKPITIMMMIFATLFKIGGKSRFMALGKSIYLRLQK